MDGGQDYCVICKGETPFTKETPVEHRQHYVSGTGQLCEKCCKDVNRCDGKNCPAAYF